MAAPRTPARPARARARAAAWAAAARRAAAGTRAAARRRGNSHDLRRQAEAPPPDPAEEPDRLHAPRLRGQGLDPLRGLRARLDLRGAHPGLLGARDPAAPGRQA